MTSSKTARQERIGNMNAKRIVMAGMLMSFMLAGCLMAPESRHREVVLAPPLPPIVVLGDEPYYVSGGYHYHYRNDGWYYSQSRSGPWVELPRDRYPREVKFKDGGPERNEGRIPPGHQGIPPGHQRK
jgi:hypothetical protein